MDQIIIGSDHAGFELKTKLIIQLGNDFEVEDAGTDSEVSMDYPDIGLKVARAVSKENFPRGILICGTGIGMSMTANRIAGVRAALCHDLFSARMSRAHNDANILVLGGRVSGDILAFEIVKTWLTTAFEGGRHQRRLDKFNKGG